jgi:hypothetical protein
MHFNITHLGEYAAIAEEQARVGDDAKRPRSASLHLAAQRARRCFRGVPNEGPDPSWQRWTAQIAYAPKPDQLQRAVQRGRVGLPWTGRPTHVSRGVKDTRSARFIKPQKLVNHLKIGTVKEVAAPVINFAAGSHFGDAWGFGRGFIHGIADLWLGL